MKIINIETLSFFLKSRGLTFSEELIRDQITRKLHRLVLPVSDGRTDLIFKLLLENSPETKKRFLVETQVLQKFKSKIIDHRILVNNIIKSGDNPSPWFIASLVPGVTGGSIFEFEERYLSIDFIEVMVELFQILTDSKDKFDELLKGNENQIFIESNLKRFEDPLLCQYQKVVEMLSKQVRSRDSLTLSHSDLTPLNLLFSNKGIGLIDWESISFRDKVFDPVYVFHRLWMLPDWQDKYKQLVFKKYLSSGDLDAFNFYLLLLLALDIQTISSLLKKDESRLYQDKAKYSKNYLDKKISLYLQKVDEITTNYG